MSFQGRVLTNKMDNYNTPLEGWKDILSFIPDKNTKIWLPFYNDGKAKKLVNSLGYKKVYHKNKDYFTYWKDDHILIDNPPFSLKKDVIDYAFNKNKPFCLLLPFDTIERKYLKNYSDGLQIVIPQNRYKYIDNPKANPPFKSIWMCWRMNLKNGEKLIFL
jgi:hypothetical protein